MQIYQLQFCQLHSFNIASLWVSLRCICHKRQIKYIVKTVINQTKHSKLCYLYISAFPAQGQAAVPLSAAWHSALLQLPAQVKAKRTLIFLVGPSVDKQGRSSHTRELSHRAHRTHNNIIVSCRDGCCCSILTVIIARSW